MKNRYRVYLSLFLSLVLVLNGLVGFAGMPNGSGGKNKGSLSQSSPLTAFLTKVSNFMSATSNNGIAYDGVTGKPLSRFVSDNWTEYSIQFWQGEEFDKDGEIWVLL